jgi:hypothetical protein
MVCCFSMVQRVLARQSNSEKSTVDSKNVASSSGSSEGISDGINSMDTDPLPARAVTSGEAAERVWKYLNTIPPLMEVCNSHIRIYTYSWTHIYICMYIYT